MRDHLTSPAVVAARDTFVLADRAVDLAHADAVHAVAHATPLTVEQARDDLTAARAERTRAQRALYDAVHAAD